VSVGVEEKNKYFFFALDTVITLSVFKGISNKKNTYFVLQQLKFLF